MEILFITHKYPPSIGGMEKQSFELINGVKKYHTVHTLIYDNKTSKIKFLLSIPRRVKKILKENPGISIIHLNDGLLALFSLAIKRFSKRPLLVTLHGLDVVFPNKIFQKWVMEKFQILDGVIAVSQATALECLKRGFDPKKVFVVRNGVDTDLSNVYRKFGFRSELEKKIGISLGDKKILVSVGRSVRRKGFSWFVNRVLPNLDKDVVYLIIGPTNPHIRKIHFLLSILPSKFAHQISLAFGLGVDEIEINRALKKSHINGRAFYLGKLPFEDMVQVLKHSDLFIMPNIQVTGDAEGFGLVALEASICGLPVLASAIEGITCAVIDGENGFLVPPEQEEVWIDKIQSLLSDTESLKVFGEAAKHYTISNYKWERMVGGYISVFKKYDALRSVEYNKLWALDEKDVSDITERIMWQQNVMKKNARYM